MTRLKIAIAKSSNGIARIVNGKSSGSSAEPPFSSVITEASTWPVKVIADALIRRPKNIAPESPIKICAGWKLCGKNPRHRPITTAVIRDGAPARFKPLTTANKYEKAKNEADKNHEAMKKYC